MTPPQVQAPSRGEIWLVDFNPTKGREQAGVRPCLVLSVDPFNHGPLDLVIGIPITSTHRGWPTHVGVKPPEGGLKNDSFIKCEDLRSMSNDRFIKRIGVVSRQTMADTESRVRIILGL
ncbi:type II toxin-antitoxin system PemK/MazF family toxin [Bdellovibrionota bacterium FG-1]